MVVASIYSIASEKNFKTFTGNVTASCLDGGDWYALACGPRGSGAESLGFAAWKASYTVGYSPLDSRDFEWYAARMHDRAEELGFTSSGNEGGEALAAANAWINRDKDLPHDEMGAGFMYRMCRAVRAPSQTRPVSESTGSLLRAQTADAELGRRGGERHRPGLLRVPHRFRVPHRRPVPVHDVQEVRMVAC